MSIYMSSIALTKQSSCINFHIISATSNKQSVFGSRSRFHFNLSSSRKGQRKHTFTVSCSNIHPVPPPVPPPTPSSDSSPCSTDGFLGKGWIAGTIVALLLSFLKNKWGPLFLLKNEVDQKLQRIEDVAEGLEKLADGVEHMAENVGKKLQEGSSLKRVADLIEDAAEKVELAAHLTDTAIDKIQELEDEMESYAEQNHTKPDELNEENKK